MELIFEPRKSENISGCCVYHPMISVLWELAALKRMHAEYVVYMWQELQESSAEGSTREHEDNGYMSEKGERGFPGAVTLQLNLGGLVSSWQLWAQKEKDGGQKIKKISRGMLMHLVATQSSCIKTYMIWALEMYNFIVAKGWKKNAQNAYLKHCLKLRK